LRTLPEERIPSFEEHLLVCEPCQDRLLEMETYVDAVRSVSPKLRAARTPLFALPHLGWASAGGVALAAALLVVGWVSPPPVRGPDTAVVRLEATRGTAGPADAQAIAGQTVAFEIDRTQIPQLASYRLEIVNAAGTREQESWVAPEGSSIRHVLADGLPAGRHYVRLYGSGGALLREFGLLVAAGSRR
jgi:hypothetical protein